MKRDLVKLFGYKVNYEIIFFFYFLLNVNKIREREIVFPNNNN
jgi:hypothetical protein